MPCAWSRPEPLTGLYGVVLLASVPLLFLVSRIELPEEARPLLDGPRRDNWIDAARAVLMIFIIAGHFASVPVIYIPETTYWLRPLLAWINLFVMPGFAVLSGYLSRQPLNSKRAARLMIYVALPYLLSKLAIYFFSCFMQGQVLYFNPFDSFTNGDVQWYLASLVQWRLAYEAMRPLSRSALIALALAAGLGSGYWVPDSSLLALHRTMAFFPCFVAGVLLDLGRFRAAMQVLPKWRWALQAVFVGSLAVFFARPALAEPFLAMGLGNLDKDYTRSPTGVPRELCGSEWALSFVHRAIRYELQAVLLAGLFASVPDTPALATPGRSTMYPYLLHPWVCDTVFLPWLARHPAMLMKSLLPFSAGGFVWLYTVLLAPVLFLALATPPVRSLTAWVIEPTWAAPWLFSPDVAAHFAPAKGQGPGRDLLGV